MKKKTIVIMGVVVFSLVACGSFLKPKDSIKDYYPFKENIKMKYAGEGSEYASQELYVDFIKDNRIQNRVINPGTVVAQILEYKDGELRLLTSKGEFYYRQDITSMSDENVEIILKEPLVKGTSWDVYGDRKRTITGIDVETETPLGKYKALEVTTEGPEFTTKDYYVRNVGLVKTIFKGKDTEIISSLEKMDKDAYVEQNIKFYYPDVINNKIVYKEDNIQLKTNDEIKDVFEKYFKKAPGENIGKIMSENTKINKLYLDMKENVVYVDFSKEFIEDMKKNKFEELLILKSVTNTLGDYFNTDKVYISIDGNPYKSNNITLKEKEFIKVDYKDISRLE